MTTTETQNPQFGFVIDHRKCIGCHACTVACKSENDVPLGQFRTWVKYVEKGSFPEIRRHFSVMRCNHCDAAPCVTICPVTALDKRPDAIVDLDRDVCIGCRACMQACPYDAIYLNEDKGVAEKCHYCAHRTEVGLEPACVVVCPERAIIPGDTTDPDSEISKALAELPTERRKLEKGTRPRVWYVDALPEALVPGSAQEPESFLWSQRPQPPHPVPEGFEAPTDLTTTFDISHPPVWGWHIWTYLVTKNLAAGAMLIAPLLGLLGVGQGKLAIGIAPEVVALVFLGVTLFLLVHDLGRPERFLKLLLRPNTKSWLVKGAWVLTIFGGLTLGSLIARILGHNEISNGLRWFCFPAAVMTAGYSAFLFAQCRGRDLWLESGLFTKLALRAVVLGAALGVALAAPGGHGLECAGVYLVAFVTLWWLESRTKYPTRDGEKAHAIFKASGNHGMGIMLMSFGGMFAFAASPTFPMVGAALGGAALVLAFAGQLTFERGWIESGQAVPNS